MSAQGVTIQGEGVGPDPGVPKGTEAEAGTKGASTQAATVKKTEETVQTPEQKAAADKVIADKAIADKVIADKAAADKTAAERPAWLPEKFKTPEELAKSYSELERKLSEGDKASDVKLGVKKVDFDAVAREFAENGKISDDTYAKLDEGGIPRRYVDEFIVGQVARSEKVQTMVAEIAGGPGSLEQVKAWGQTNLPQEEIDAYNSLVDSGNPVSIRLALEGLVAKYRKATGQEPDRVSGEAGGRGTAGPQPFKSSAEVVEAMKDPRYAKDPAYRRMIEQRLAVSE